MTTDLGSKVHHAFIEPLLRTGRVPSGAEVALVLGVPKETIRDALLYLGQTHGVVLHPHVCEPWIIHPFSLSPSATWVEGAERGWWAPCMWCAFGIAALAHEPVTIHTRLGGEAEDLDIHVENGLVRETDILVHFALPPRAAWDNVQHFCATVLPFSSEDRVHAWSERHGLPTGAVIPIQQCADLGRDWYFAYAESNWRKWSVTQAADIFAGVGLTGAFWALPPSDGRF